MTNPKEIDRERLVKIVEKHRGKASALIPVLQEIQEAFSYIPPESIEYVADALGLFPSEVQGVITFYAGFSLQPKGKYVVRVCRGTACHVKGGRNILRLARRELALREGETSPDYQFTLETVGCIGACFLAPTMMVNRTYYGKLSPPRVASILTQYGRAKRED
jgi:NADH:ubiquinone oxidoreductase subunit E